MDPKIFLRNPGKKHQKDIFRTNLYTFGEYPELVRLAARAGIRIVFVGMESVNPKTLQSYGKTINLNDFNKIDTKNLSKEFVNRELLFSVLLYWVVMKMISSVFHSYTKIYKIFTY